MGLLTPIVVGLFLLYMLCLVDTRVAISESSKICDGYVWSLAWRNSLWACHIDHFVVAQTSHSSFDRTLNNIWDRIRKSSADINCFLICQGMSAQTLHATKHSQRMCVTNSSSPLHNKHFDSLKIMCLCRLIGRYSVIERLPYKMLNLVWHSQFPHRHHNARLVTLGEHSLA